MLPFDDKKKQPSVYVSSDSDDLLGSARKQCMSRLMNAMSSQDASAALEAFDDLLALSED